MKFSIRCLVFDSKMMSQIYQYLNTTRVMERAIVCYPSNFRTEEMAYSGSEVLISGPEFKLQRTHEEA